MFYSAFLLQSFGTAACPFFLKGFFEEVSPGYLNEEKIGMADERVEPLQVQGKTVVFVLVDGQLKGAIALADIIRPEAEASH